jgi:hypothetical protein
MAQENATKEKVHSGATVALRVLGFIFGTIVLLWLIKVLLGI